MEKEQIISTLTEKLGQTSFSQRTISDYVDNNLPTDGAEPDDAYWTKHVNIIKSLQGNYSADMAKAIADQLPSKSSEYFTKNPDKLKEFIKSNPELAKLLSEPQVQTDEDPKYKALEDKINELLKKQSEDGKKAQVSALRTSAKGKANNLKVTRTALWEDAVDKVSYEEGDTETSFLDKVKAQYSKDAKRYFGDGEKPYGGNNNPGSGSGNGNAKVVNDFFAKKKAKMQKK